jgi:hypothetical protein
MKNRLPLSERARRAREGRFITMDSARRQFDNPASQLETNTFSLDLNITRRKRKITSLLVSHFGSIARNTHFSITVEEYPSLSYYIEITARRHRSNEEPLLRIIFQLYRRHGEKFIELEKIESRGLGGAAAAALYNFAQELDIEYIEFLVLLNHAEAAKFYFHADFGQPMSENSLYGPWIVIVPPKEYQPT